MAQVLKHIVLFAFKDTSSEQDIQEVIDAFVNLKQAIAGVQELEWGTNVSIENLAQGFSHCFQLSFLSEADRNAYLPHPAHKAFGEILSPHLEKVLVVDYWAKDA